MLHLIDIDKILKISEEAGVEILKIYAEDFEVYKKSDHSPLTDADEASNEVIVNALNKLYPEIPIISEERKVTDYQERKSWEYCWLVDPLDGTKEFIKKNGEFTVNIALVQNGHPVLGVIYIPVTGQFYYGIKGQGSFRMDKSGNKYKIQAEPPEKNGIYKVAGSRSHRSEAIEEFINSHKSQYSRIDYLPAGSALKFTLVAEGKAHVYPRYGPTMEWDTAAGQIIVEEAGGRVLRMDNQHKMGYNKEDLHNPYFIVHSN